MNSRVRDILLLVAGLAVVLAAALGGYAAVRARAQGSGTGQALAPVATADAGRRPARSRRSTTAGRSARPSGPLTVYTRAEHVRAGAGQAGQCNQTGYPMLVLVDSTKEVGGRVWYRVWLAVPPNESQGWVPEGKLAFYTTTAKIIDRPLRAQALRLPSRGASGEVPSRSRSASRA